MFGDEFDFGPDISRKYLSKILEEGKPQYWYFGHWHRYFHNEHQFDNGTLCIWRGLDVCGTSIGYIMEEW